MPNPGSDIPERCCKNCHFLARIEFIQVGGIPEFKAVYHAMPPTDRNILAQGILPFRDVPGRREPDPYGCSREVWSSDLLEDNSPYAIKTEVTKDRGERCFFYPCNPEMSFDSASVLECRAADRREAERDRKVTRGEAEKDRRHTRRAFCVAVAAVIISFLAIAFNMLWNIWQHFHPPNP